MEFSLPSLMELETRIAVLSSSPLEDSFRESSEPELKSNLLLSSTSDSEAELSDFFSTGFSFSELDFADSKTKT